MLRKLLLTAGAFCLLSIIACAQIYDPVTWDFSYEKKSDGKYELVFRATIEKGSHIYSMDIPEGGPIPTSFTFDSLPGFSLDGKPYEALKPLEIFDEAFGFKIKTFSEKAEFRQKIISKNDAFKVTGVVNFMSCNNKTCSPPKDVEFTFNIGKKGTTTDASKTGSQIQTIGITVPKKGLLRFFLLSLLAGFAGVITPCVFPMIPMTVAFFSRDSENRSKSVIKAIIFGFSIVVIYTLLGAIVSLSSAGAGFANALSNN